jgi:putative flippase GtrA
MKQHLFNLRDFIIAVIDWFHIPFKRIPVETFRYIATGGSNTLLDIILYFLVYNFVLDKHDIDLLVVTVSPHIGAFLVVFPLTFCTGFLLARYITFTESEIRGRVQLIRYMLSVAGAIVLNYIFLKLFVEYFDMWPTVAKIATTVIVVVYSYITQRFFTFKTGQLRK